MGAKVSIRMDVALNLGSILFESEMVILEELGEESVELAQSMWTGWKYGKYYPPAQKGTSFAGWKLQRVWRLVIDMLAMFTELERLRLIWFGRRSWLK